MSTATLPVAVDVTELEDLFDLDVRIEVSETAAEAAFTSVVCSVTCASCIMTACCGW
ncbi:FDLD family class I lanthipeptide [Kitasatospora sp. GAS204B]|uniref:FDLD family class I lanthipeptide n=1 Tax=unclassified Kitasatospora TaxID=2633591 RepID=UPI0024770A99|nr:FDLD family class I lanthipeptide [Kitasatospora sp. GAS204B]MDH6121334.1 hypothetical protein [Kitasatospora sp. GAS204B]